MNNCNNPRLRSMMFVVGIVIWIVFHTVEMMNLSFLSQQIETNNSVGVKPQRNGMETMNISTHQTITAHPIKQQQHHESQLQPIANLNSDSSSSNRQPFVTNRSSCFVPNINLPSVIPPPKPILNLGMPKCGTTTLNRFFTCGGIIARHQRCGSGYGPCARCIKKAVSKHLPPLQTCGNWDAYTQIDFNVKGFCYFPQIENLREFHDESPNATFMLLFRDIDRWVRSVTNWHNMKNRLARCNITGFPPGVGRTDDELKQLFCRQVERVRKFVAEHPSHALIEIDIEDASTGTFMSDVFHINESCWGHANQNVKLIAKHRNDT